MTNPHAHATEDQRDVFQDKINFTTPHANPFAVNRRIGPAVDDSAAARSDFHPVTVPPDTGIHIKIAIEVTFVLWIIPEEQRHRGHWLGDDQFPHFINQRVAVIIERFYFGAKRAALNFPSAYREQDRATQES